MRYPTPNVNTGILTYPMSGAWRVFGPDLGWYYETHNRGLGRVSHTVWFKITDTIEFEDNFAMLIMFGVIATWACR